jgi:hypothetical protein
MNSLCQSLLNRIKMHMDTPLIIIPIAGKRILYFLRDGRSETSLACLTGRGIAPRADAAFYYRVKSIGSLPYLPLIPKFISGQPTQIVASLSPRSDPWAHWRQSWTEWHSGS